MEPQKYDSQVAAKSASPEATEKSSLSVFTLSDDAVMKNSIKIKITENLTLPSSQNQRKYYLIAVLFSAVCD